jgi:LacI family transcriptional regulator
MYDHQLPINNDYIWFGEFSQQCGIDFIEWYVKQDSEKKPTAVISGSSIITYGIMLGAKQYGIRIPEDLSLVSYGNIGYEKLIEPQITYIQQMAEEISMSSAKMIIEKINNPNNHIKQIVLKPGLIINNSVRDLNATI